MNKKILLGLSVFFIVLAIGTIIFAYTGKFNLAKLYPQSEEKISNQEVYLNISKEKYSLNNKEEKILFEKAKTYIPYLTGKKDINLDLIKDLKIEGHYDNTTEQNFVDITTNDFTISLNENKTLRAFSDNTIDYSKYSNSNKEYAKKYITELYNNLDISHDYELTYLEIFDEYLWEAGFTKKIDNIYNIYDSIKVYFTPEQKKIAAMRIHSTYNTQIVNVNTENIVPEKDIINIIQENFENIKEKDISKVEIVYTKPNNFFTKKDYGDIISENKIVKAYKITITLNDKTIYVFVDINTGNIIGGDMLK